MQVWSNLEYLVYNHLKETFDIEIVHCRRWFILETVHKRLLFCLVEMFNVINVLSTQHVIN